MDLRCVKDRLPASRNSPLFQFSRRRPPNPPLTAAARRSGRSRSRRIGDVGDELLLIFSAARDPVLGRAALTLPARPVPANNGPDAFAVLACNLIENAL